MAIGVAWSVTTVFNLSAIPLWSMPASLVEIGLYWILILTCHQCVGQIVLVSKNIVNYNLFLISVFSPESCLLLLAFPFILFLMSYSHHFWFALFLYQNQHQHQQQHHHQHHHQHQHQPPQQHHHQHHHQTITKTITKAITTAITKAIPTSILHCTEKKCTDNQPWSSFKLTSIVPGYRRLVVINKAKT